MRLSRMMSHGDDAFGPKKDAELLLELDEGFEGSGRTQRRSIAPAAVAEGRQANPKDVFARAQGAPQSVYTAEQPNRRKRATLTQHQDFIDEVNARLSEPEGYAQKQAAARRLYWYLTRAPILALLAWFTLSHLVFGSSWVFIDGVNLAFHEAGHPMFRWGGDTLYFLGGTIGQLIWPAMMAGYFHFKMKQRFATAVCLWWVAENFINIGRYVADAERMELPLVGGDTHDWNHLLSKWDMLGSAESVASTVRLLGVVGMLGCLGYLCLVSLSPSDDELAEGFRA